MDAAIIIPARYASSRFPGKPLADIAGKSLLNRVWERCIPVLGADSVFVATDDERIAKHCDEKGMQWVMTSRQCMTGTDRLAEAARKISAGTYINVQGDEPLIQPGDIEKILNASRLCAESVLNAYCPILEERDYLSRNVPKVVVRPDGRLLYVSRSPIPGSKKPEFKFAYRQVCIYAFKGDALQSYAECGDKTALEKVEDVEILRFLELGYDVRMVPLEDSSIAVDTPDDISRVISVLNRKGL